LFATFFTIITEGAISTQERGFPGVTQRYHKSSPDGKRSFPPGEQRATPIASHFRGRRHTPLPILDASRRSRLRADRGAIQPAAIVASPLERARQTAESRPRTRTGVVSVPGLRIRFLRAHGPIVRGLSRTILNDPHRQIRDLRWWPECGESREQQGGGGSRDWSDWLRVTGRRDSVSATA